MFKHAKCYRCNIPISQFIERKRKKKKSVKKIKENITVENKQTLILNFCNIKNWMKTK